MENYIADEFIEVAENAKEQVIILARLEELREQAEEWKNDPVKQQVYNRSLGRVAHKKKGKTAVQIRRSLVLDTFPFSSDLELRLQLLNRL